MARRALFWMLMAFITWSVIIPMTKENITHNTPHTITSQAIAKTVPEPDNGWHVNESISEMDDSKTVVLSKNSENVVEAWLKKVRPTLIIRCLEGKTDVYMDIKGAVQPVAGLYDTHGVEIRIDAQKQYMELWKQSTNGAALFAPKPIAFARKLEGSKKLLLRYLPFNVPPATVEFDISGLDVVLPKVAQNCKWRN